MTAAVAALAMTAKARATITGAAVSHGRFDGIFCLITRTQKKHTTFFSGVVMSDNQLSDLIDEYACERDAFYEREQNRADLRRILRKRSFDEYADEVGARPGSTELATKVRALVTETIKQNDDLDAEAIPRMREIKGVLDEHGIDIDRVLGQNVLETVLTQNVPPEIHELNNTLPTVDSRYEAKRIHEPESVVHVLEPSENAEEDEVVEESLGAAQVLYFTEERDKLGIEEAVKDDSGVGIRVGTNYIESDFTVELKPHQREAIICTLQRMGGEDLDAQGYIIAHCMGLGKTLTTIAILHAVKLRKMIVCCPAMLQISWMEELQKWSKFHNMFCHGIMSAANESSIITNWNVCGGLLVVTHKRFEQIQLDASKTTLVPDVLVIDEAHSLKNKTSLLHQAVDKTRTRRKLLLTGTPFQNNIMEYYTMLKLVAPTLFESEETFKDEFVSVISKGMLADVSDDTVSDAKMKTQVFYSIAKPVLHRRTTQVLQQSLPDRREYMLLVSTSKKPDLTGMTAFAQTHETMAAVLSDKKRMVRRLVREIRASGGKTLIFSPRVESVHKVSQMLGCPALTGESTSDGQRSEIVRQFKDGQWNELCMTTRVGGVGLNLQEANFIIIMDPSWNPAHDNQACFRAYRYGQTRPVTIFRLISKDTLQERIYRLSVFKVMAAHRLVDNAQVARILTNDQLHLREDFGEETRVQESDITDNVLKVAFNTASAVYNTDVLFAHESSEQLTEEEQATADNDFFKICAKSETYTAMHPMTNVECQVSNSDLYYPLVENTLILLPPRTPYWKRVANGKAYKLRMPRNPIETPVLTYEYETLYNNDFNASKFHTTTHKSVSFERMRDVDTVKVRIRIQVDDQTSEWSGWCASMLF